MTTSNTNVWGKMKMQIFPLVTIHKRNLRVAIQSKMRKRKKKNKREISRSCAQRKRQQNDLVDRDTEECFLFKKINIKQIYEYTQSNKTKFEHRNLKYFLLFLHFFSFLSPSSPFILISLMFAFAFYAIKIISQFKTFSLSSCRRRTI